MFREHDIEGDKIGQLSLGQLQCPLSVGSRQGPETGLLEIVFDRLNDVLLVVDDEDFRLGDSSAS